MMPLKRPVAVIAIMSAIFVGCSGANNPDVAALRAELQIAHAKIDELQAEIARGDKDGKRTDAGKHPPKAKARLVVVRGLRPNWEYPVYEGRNILGRADEQPVDIDLQPQEPEARIWSSRQHAVIICKSGAMVIEDLKSASGTYVNRKRVPPGEQCPLRKDDIIQIGEVHIRVLE